MSGDDAVARVIDNNIEPIIKERMPLYLANGGSFLEWLTSRAIDRHTYNYGLLREKNTGEIIQWLPTLIIT